MAAVDDKVNALQFSAETGLTREEIREAGRRAMEAGKRAMVSSIQEVQVEGDLVRYAIMGPGKVVRQMAFVVSSSEVSLGRREVRVSVDTFVTMRQTFMFIPVSPRSAPALKSFAQFVAHLRRELAVR